MIAEVGSRRMELADLCRRFGVRRLDLFGSAARGDFDPERSDLDFLVEFEPDARTARSLGGYFDLRTRSRPCLGGASTSSRPGRSAIPTSRKASKSRRSACLKRDPKCFLSDARGAADAIAAMRLGKTFGDLDGDIDVI